MSNGLIDLNTIIINATKIEASANKYTFVFTKNFDCYETQLLEKSKVKYHELVDKNIIPELERESDTPLTAEEIAVIHDKMTDIEASHTQDIERAPDVLVRREIRKKRSDIRRSKKAFKDYLD